MKVTFLGKDYIYTYFNGDNFVAQDSCLSFVCYYDLRLYIENNLFLKLDIDASKLSTCDNVDAISNVVQELLDENQEMILLKLVEKINEMSKVISLISDEFAKSIILL